jgi:peptidyl-prolyl cis-trans isomerase NIMA-interacting 1
MKSLPSPLVFTAAPARAFAWMGALLLSAGCQEPAPALEGGPPALPSSAAPSASADRPGPWANDAPPSASPTADAPVREIAGAAHILIAYKGALGAAKTITRSKADAKKRAEETLKRLKDDKATFEQLVKESSDDPLSVPAAGAIGNFERNVMPQAFSDATFDLPVGGVSSVVETPRGFHIIRRTK